MIKIVSEALFRLKIDAFKDWLIHKGKEEVLRRFLISEKVIELIKNPDPAHPRNTQWPFELLNKLLISFEEEIRQNIFGPTAQFWQSFLFMSQVLLNYIKSFRIGDWQLHLCSMEKMLPCFHAYDGISYARHFTHCFASFQKLDETHSSILGQFQRGNFAIKRTNESFNMLPRTNSSRKRSTRSRKVREE